jgi:hypothetical protein
MEVDVRFGTSVTFLYFSEVLGPLFLAHVLYLQPSHLEVESILALQYGVSLIGRAIIMRIKMNIRYKGTTKI